MCYVCQGQVPHPPVQDIPSYIYLVQLLFGLFLGYWAYVKMKVFTFFKDLIKGNTKEKK